jgi:hypothetical protein
MRYDHLNMLPELAFKPLGKHMTLEGGGKKAKTPKAPDYISLANTQSKNQLNLNRNTTQANRVDQSTPWASLKYTQDPNDPDKWSSNVELTPELQNILNNQFSAQGQAYGSLQDYLSNIQDSSRIPKAAVNPGQTAQQAIMARLDPTFTQNEDALRTRLMNQGVRPGTEAWDREYRNFNMGKNDAYSQAALQGIGLDNQARATALQEQALPLQAIQSYISGNSVQTPNFANYNTQANTSAPDLLNAANAGYQGNLASANAQNAASNNFTSGLFSLGGAALGGPIGGALGKAFGGFLSDKRLKTNIKRIGIHPLGIGIYEYDKLGMHEIGVLAQEVEEVMPEAVSTHWTGFKMVNYDMIGGLNG